MASRERLPFTVVYCSSEDPKCPSAHLNASLSPYNRGWSSGKFPEDPQEVIVQFTGGGINQVHEMQVLSHEYKIAKRIDVFAFVPDAESQSVHLSKVNFQRMGYFELAPPPPQDTESDVIFTRREINSEIRELKSVYM
jgi:centrosomal protein CEP104